LVGVPVSTVPTHPRRLRDSAAARDRVRMLRMMYTLCAAPNPSILLGPGGHPPGELGPRMEPPTPARSRKLQLGQYVTQFFFIIRRTQAPACPVTSDNQPGALVRCVIFAPRKYTAADQAMTSA